MKNLLILLFIVCFNKVALSGNADKEKAVTKVIAGKIADENGESLAGAKISIAETGETFFSDMDGNFKLNLKTDKVYTLNINTIGYAPLEVKSTGLSAFSDLSLKQL